LTFPYNYYTLYSTMLRYETTAMLINASMLIVDVYLKKSYFQM